MNEDTLLENIKPLNILLVEDDDGDAKAVQRAMQKSKISNKIFRAVDGLEALDILKGKSGKDKIPYPVLLFIDINMPRMNGIELVKTLRADPELSKTIIFILTTSKRDEDKAAAYNLNVSGYIIKEKAGQDFLRLVNLIDSYWRVVEMP